MMKYNQKGHVQSRIKKVITSIIKGIFYAVIGFMVVALFGFVVKWLWNGLLPDIFGIKTITYWQALGLLLLGRILFGGFGGQSEQKAKSKRDEGVPIDNMNHEEMYDRWWQEKGEASFDAFLKDNQV